MTEYNNFTIEIESKSYNWEEWGTIYITRTPPIVRIYSEDINNNKNTFDLISNYIPIILNTTELTIESILTEDGNHNQIRDHIKSINKDSKDLKLLYHIDKKWDGKVLDNNSVDNWLRLGKCNKDPCNVPIIVEYLQVYCDLYIGNTIFERKFSLIPDFTK